MQSRDIKELLNIFLAEIGPISCLLSETQVIDECVLKIGSAYAVIEQAEEVKPGDYLVVSEESEPWPFIFQTEPIDFFSSDNGYAFAKEFVFSGKQIGQTVTFEANDLRALKIENIFRCKHVLHKATTLKEFGNNFLEFQDRVREFLKQNSVCDVAKQLFQNFVDFLGQKNLIEIDETLFEKTRSDLIKLGTYSRPESKEELDEMHREYRKKINDGEYLESVKNRALDAAKRTKVGELLCEQFNLNSKFVADIAGEEFFSQLPIFTFPKLKVSPPSPS